MSDSVIRADELTIVLSGRVEGGKYVVRIGDGDVLLTHALFQIFVDLVLARLTTNSGRTTLPSAGGDRNLRQVTLHRLRRAIDTRLGAGTGAALIHSATRGEFFLSVPVSVVAIEEDVVELAPHHLDDRLLEKLVTAAAKLGLLCKRCASEM